MKKIIFIALIIAALLIPITAIAATSNSSSCTIAPEMQKKFQKIDPSKLTDAQKKDLEYQHAKMLALQKETINKMVSNSTITKEQGDEMLKRIDDMEKIRKEKGIVPMPGQGKGNRGEGRRGGMKGCPQGGCNPNGVTPPATQAPTA